MCIFENFNDNKKITYSSIGSECRSMKYANNSFKCCFLSIKRCLFTKLCYNRVGLTFDSFTETANSDTMMLPVYLMFCDFSSINIYIYIYIFIGMSNSEITYEFG